VKTILRELIGLFVDDGRFAVTILVWVGLLGLLFPRLPLVKHWHAPLLLIGLLAILLESVWRATRPVQEPPIAPKQDAH
jgi:hypothetical protein